MLTKRNSYEEKWPILARSWLCNDLKKSTGAISHVLNDLEEISEILEPQKVLNAKIELSSFLNKASQQYTKAPEHYEQIKQKIITFTEKLYKNLNDPQPHIKIVENKNKKGT